MKQVSGAQYAVIAVVVFGLLCCVNAARAAEDNPQQAKLKIEKVALFKNGLGFFTSTAGLPKNATTVRLGQVPVPAFGTFWVGYSKDVRLRSLVASMEELEETMSVQNIGQFLQANAGCKAIIRTGPEGKDIVEGTILKEAAAKEMPEPPSPYFMDIRRRSDPDGRAIYSQGPSNVLLVKTDRGTVALNAGSIVRADLESDNIVSSIPIKHKRPSIRMEMDKPAGGENVSVSYLGRGVTWAPGYLIDLSDAKTAKFSAHALIVNELADFNNVTLDLVTGFPNIKFGEVSSPIAMSQSLADFLTTLAGGRSAASRDRSVLTQQAVLFNVADFDAITPPPLPSYSTAAEGLVSEDLFLYPVKDFTLMKGETAWIPLFTAEMPYKHVYTWKIGDILDKEDRYRTEAERDEGKAPAEEVWHSCRLVNNLDMPLTTAATEFVTDGQFTGQDVCYYTAPGAETTIRINRAMNVLAEQAEAEIARTRNAAQFYGNSYDLVKVQGELKLRSRLKEAAHLEITKELSGEVIEKTPAAKDVQTAKGLKQVNPRHVLTWEIELKPGEEQKLTYVYQVYIRV